eukprot:763620-Hanusia_phi.AAC.4
MNNRAGEPSVTLRWGTPVVESSEGGRGGSYRLVGPSVLMEHFLPLETVIHGTRKELSSVCVGKALRLSPRMKRGAIHINVQQTTNDRWLRKCNVFCMDHDVVHGHYIVRPDVPALAPALSNHLSFEHSSILTFPDLYFRRSRDALVTSRIQNFLLASAQRAAASRMCCW